jgi:hypothetical protein
VSLTPITDNHAKSTLRMLQLYGFHETLVQRILSIITIDLMAFWDSIFSFFVVNTSFIKNTVYDSLLVSGFHESYRGHSDQ